MNHFIRIIILAVFAATSCTKGIISSDDLPEVLADLYMTDRFVLNSPQAMLKADSSMVYEPVLNKYGYTTDEFIHTMDYYLPRPNKLKSFFLKAKEILAKREMEVSQRILAQSQGDSLLAGITYYVEKADSLKEMDSYERSVRWMLAPEKLPYWRIYLHDSLALRYEIPQQLQWWSNNMITKRKSLLKYAKNSSPISLPIEQSTDPEGLSLPQH